MGVQWRPRIGYTIRLRSGAGAEGHDETAPTLPRWEGRGRIRSGLIPGSVSGERRVRKG